MGPLDDPKTPPEPSVVVSADPILEPELAPRPHHPGEERQDLIHRDGAHLRLGGDPPHGPNVTRPGAVSSDAGLLSAAPE